jgi:hypothetical protein
LRPAKNCIISAWEWNEVLNNFQNTNSSNILLRKVHFAKILGAAILNGGCHEAGFLFLSFFFIRKPILFRFVPRVR